MPQVPSILELCPWTWVYYQVLDPWARSTQVHSGRDANLSKLANQLSQAHREVACRHGQAMTSDILHLTEVNPYVASTLVSGLSAHLPRQMSGSPQHEENAHTGISGFAFQGTNAHVILGGYVQTDSDSVVSPLACACHSLLC